MKRNLTQLNVEDFLINDEENKELETIKNEFKEKEKVIDSIIHLDPKSTYTYTNIPAIELTVKQ